MRFFWRDGILIKILEISPCCARRMTKMKSRNNDQLHTAISAPFLSILTAGEKLLTLYGTPGMSSRTSARDLVLSQTGFWLKIEGNQFF